MTLRDTRVQAPEPLRPLGAAERIILNLGRRASVPEAIVPVYAQTVAGGSAGQRGTHASSCDPLQVRQWDLEFLRVLRVLQPLKHQEPFLLCACS